MLSDQGMPYNIFDSSLLTFMRKRSFISMSVRVGSGSSDIPTCRGWTIGQSRDYRKFFSSMVLRCALESSATGGYVL